MNTFVQKPSHIPTAINMGHLYSQSLLFGFVGFAIVIFSILQSTESLF